MTEQMKEWSSDFGRQYTDRNPHSVEGMDEAFVGMFGVSRTALNREFLGDMDRSIRILEVGTNVGTQLQVLQSMGFTNLYGIELQHYAVEEAKKLRRQINIIQASALDIPYKDGFFDLVFTSGVLIHISPADLPTVMSEVHRCSRRYIWGIEYFSEKQEEVPYRGKPQLLWKGDYAKTYRDLFPGLKVIRERMLPHVDSSNVDKMYLLEKQS